MKMMTNQHKDDDGFLYIAKEYYSSQDGSLRSKVKELRRLNPALVEFDLDVSGLPKNAHFVHLET